jgi:hypothetical protein
VVIILTQNKELENELQEALKTSDNQNYDCAETVEEEEQFRS